jgi:hypothetical protein
MYRREDEGGMRFFPGELTAPSAPSAYSAYSVVQ